MEVIREYLLSVTAGAMVCAVVCRLVDKKGMPGAISKLLTGLFMTFVVLSPLTGLSLPSVNDLTDHYRQQADAAVSAGENNALSTLRESIKSRTEAYILDKAAGLGAEITVCVTLTDAAYPVPKKVTVTGQVAPYAKARLQKILQEELGILEEDQVWN